MELWQIIIAIIGGLGLVGGIIWRFATLEVKMRLLESIPTKVERLQTKVDDIWDVFLEQGRSSRRDLRIHESAPRLSDDGKNLVPDDKKAAIRELRRANPPLTGYDLISKLKKMFTVERLAEEARERGMDLDQYLALLADYEQEVEL